MRSLSSKNNRSRQSRYLHISETDDAVAELMQQNSESEDNDPGLQDVFMRSGAATQRKSESAKGDCPATSYNIAILVVACMILRVPVIYIDFIK